MLNPTDKQLLARLVYRCALWVSLADERGGPQAQNIEERVLKRSLQDLYRKLPKDSDEREILGITLSNTTHWHRGWSDNLINLIPELKNRRDIITPTIALMILDLSRDVATAFRERSALSSLVIQVTVATRKIFSKLNPDLTPQEYANISVNEKAALHELADALGITGYLL